MEINYNTSKHYRDWVADTAKKAKEHRKREEAKRVGILFVLTTLILACGLGFCVPKVWSEISGPISSLVEDFNPNKMTITSRSENSPVTCIIVTGPLDSGMSASVRMLQGSGYEVVKNIGSEDYYKIHGDVSFGTQDFGKLIKFLNDLEN